MSLITEQARATISILGRLNNLTWDPIVKKGTLLEELNGIHDRLPCAIYDYIRCFGRGSLIPLMDQLDGWGYQTAFDRQTQNLVIETVKGPVIVNLNRPELSAVPTQVSVGASA